MTTEADKTNTGVLATIVVVGTFAMIAISALVAAMVRTERVELDAERPTAADLETVARLDAEQSAKLAAPPTWVDRERRKVSLPIDMAMKRVLDEYRADPEAASPPPPPGLVMNPAAPAAGIPEVLPDATGAAPVAPASATGAAPAAGPAGARPQPEPAPTGAEGREVPAAPATPSAPAAPREPAPTTPEGATPPPAPAGSPSPSKPSPSTPRESTPPPSRPSAPAAAPAAPSTPAPDQEPAGQQQ